MWGHKSSAAPRWSQYESANADWFDSSKQEELRYIMRQHHFPGSLTDWVSPFCAACYFIHLRTSFIFFLEGWCWQRLSQNKRLHCLDWLPLLTPYSLLRALLSTQALAVHIHITKTFNTAQIAVSGSNGLEWRFEWPHMVSKAQHSGVSLLFACFDSSVSATVWFFG